VTADGSPNISGEWANIMAVSKAQEKQVIYQLIGKVVAVLLLLVAIYIVHKIPVEPAKKEVYKVSDYERAEGQWQDYVKEMNKEPAIPVRIVP
jgi:hypothetical protein